MTCLSALDIEGVALACFVLVVALVALVDHSVQGQL